MPHISGKNIKIKKLNLKKNKNYQGAVLYPPQSHTLGKTPDCAAAFGVAAADVPTDSPAAFLGWALLVAQVVKSPAANAGD